MIPLFPLGNVLFPGVHLPLHIFEDRYRDLVRTLVSCDDEAQRRFGVVAIRQGWEVGGDAARALYPVGCVARLRTVNQHPDGRYDIVVVGGRRFRLGAVDASQRPYLLGEVELLPPDPPADATGQVLAGSVGSLFAEYVSLVAAARRGPHDPGQLPDDPTVLSYLVAAGALLTLEDRQTLLEAADTTARLRAELRLLKREVTMLRSLRVVPAPLSDLQVPTGLN